VARLPRTGFDPHAKLVCRVLPRARLARLIGLKLVQALNRGLWYAGSANLRITTGDRTGALGPGSLAVPPGPHAADIDQCVAIPPGEAKLQEPSGSLRRKADHGEALALPALDLEPVLPPARGGRAS
jgi:hypothetical protein